MIDIKTDKAISKINYKKALVFIARKKLFKPIYLSKTKSFTGYQTIGYFKSNGLMTFDITFNILNGDASLVIVQNHALYKITDYNCQKSFNIMLEPGKAKLRLIGKKANIKYHIVIH